jgi:hypothetical protein
MCTFPLFFLVSAWFSKASDEDNAEFDIELKTANIPYSIRVLD